MSSAHVYSEQSPARCDGDNADSPECSNCSCYGSMDINVVNLWYRENVFECICVIRTVSTHSRILHFSQISSNLAPCETVDEYETQRLRFEIQPIERRRESRRPREYAYAVKTCQSTQYCTHTAVLSDVGICLERQKRRLALPSPGRDEPKPKCRRTHVEQPHHARASRSRTGGRLSVLGRPRLEEAR